MVDDSISKIVKEIISKDKNILILDTCCLLDVIRCIPRNNFDVLESAFKIVQGFNGKTSDFIIILPSLVQNEWRENLEKVKLETEKFIRNHDKNNGILFRTLGLFLGDLALTVRFSENELEKKLANLSEEIILNSYCLESIEECKINAANRVIGNISPAERGKDSTKDCIIFEEILYISDLLRKDRYLKKIIFATSNTKEYFLDKSLKDQIKKDIEKYDIEIVKSLSHGYNKVKN